MGYETFGAENAPDDWSPGDPAPAGSENAQWTAERVDEFGEHVHVGAVAEAATAAATAISSHASAEVTARNAAISSAIAGLGDLATQAELDAVAGAKQSVSAKGQANGYAGLDADGKVPSAQLPSAQSGSDIDAERVAKLSRQRISIGLRGHLGKPGFELLPAIGKTVQFPLRAVVEGADLELWWGSAYRGGSEPGSLPLTHFYVEASLIGPTTDSLADPMDPFPVQLAFGGSKRARVDPGAFVGSDPLGGLVSDGDEVITRTYAVGEGTVATLGAAIASTGATTMTLAEEIPEAHPLYDMAFYAQIEDEYVLVAAGTGTNRTISRAEGGTTAATHADGSSVGHVIQVPNTKSTASATNCNSFDGNATMDMEAATDGLAPHFVLTPFMLTAQRFDAEQDVVAIIGDSNSQGQGDDAEPEAGGFAERGCVLAGMPIIQMSAGGTGLGAWLGQPYHYWQMLKMGGATIATIALGTNRSSETGEELLAQLDEEIAYAARYGVKVIACTIPPSTDPGDTPGSGEQARLDFNDGIRDVRPGSVGTLDAASYVSADEDGTQSAAGSFWYDDGGVNVYGIDLHYSPTGHAAVSVGYAEAVQRAADGETGFVVQRDFSPIAPANTVAPAVSGIAQTTQTLTRTLGTWAGYPTPSKSTKWQREGATDVWADISGATGSTYEPVVDDVGHRLRVLVTATNASGTASAPSNPTSAVTDAPATIDLNDYAGLVEWQSSRTLSLTTNDTVSSWPSAKTSGGHDSSAAETEEPLYKPNALNGIAGVLFDGVNDQMTSGATADLKPFTFVAVVKTGATLAGNPTLAGADFTGGWQIRVLGTGAVNLLRQQVADVASSSTGVISVDTAYLIVVTYSNTGAYEFRVNGVSVGTGTADATPSSTLELLGRNVQSTEAWNGHYFERAWFNVVKSGSDLDEIEAGWMSEFAIS